MAIEKTSTPVTTHIVKVTKRTCDCCGEEAPHPGHDNWLSNGGVGDFAETKLEFREGSRYPGYYECTTTALHICPECMRDFVIPMICARGKSTPTVTESEL